MKRKSLKPQTSEYSFLGKVWKYKGQSGWHFKIRRLNGQSEEGWGRKTAIWYDTKAQSYLLPVKASVRKSEGISPDLKVRVNLVLPNKTRSAHCLSDFKLTSTLGTQYPLASVPSKQFETARPGDAKSFVNRLYSDD